ncbi:MAG: septum formation initiator family protein, partial [Steroidobacteraceae bacterium]
QQLAAEVRNLKQGFEAVEERARSELGMIGSNETYYQVVPPSAPKPAVTAEVAPTALRAAAN